MKKIILLLMLIFCTIQLKAIEPIVQVPQLPADLDAYTDDENIYFSKLMDYYLPAKMLETQIILYKQKPNQTIPQLTYDIISDLDAKTISKYYKIAKNLYNQVQLLQYSQIDNELANSKAAIEKLNNQIVKLSLDTTGIGQIVETNEFLKENNQELRQKMNEIEKAYLQKIAELDKQFYETKMQYAKNERIYPAFLLTTSPVIEQFFFSNDDLSAPISPGVMVNLSLVKLWDNTTIISLWGKYQYLTAKVTNPANASSVENTYYNNVWNFGLDFELNLSKVLEIKDFSWTFKFGGGYLVQNIINSDQNSINGNVIKLEFDFYNFSKTLPFGVIIGTTFNKYGDPIVIGELTMGREWVPTIYAGLKFDLVRIY
ncbi:MAG TPA: hypothetical protein P5216_01545 [Bacteroidota bacterium]|nr:hypothetical protein [Bacteroidota bacterium]